MSLSVGEIKQYLDATEHIYKHLYFVRDLVLVPLLLAIIYLYLHASRKRQPLELQKYYLTGFHLKLLAIPLFLFHHTFIYIGGVDQFTYYWSSNEIIQMWFVKPELAAKILFSSYSTFNEANVNIEMSKFIFAPNESFCIKVTSVIAMLSGNTYLITSILLSLFAYVGTWKIYRVVNDFYPGHAKLFAWSTIFIPSIIFWTSVISKEVYCIGAMGFLLYYLMEVFYKKKFKFVYFLYIALFSYIILRIKLYILLALVIGFIFFVLFNKIEKVRNPILRIMVLPLSLLLLGGMLTIVGSAFEDSLRQFAFSNILDTIKTNYDYLTQENFASSRYTLGEIEPTLGSVAKLAPASINVTLFRPYLWEANKPITLLAALESLLTLGLTLFVLFKVRLRALYFIFSEKFVLFCFIFAMIFSIAVGLTSGNFGTLMRYKIPLMPFYYSALAIIYMLWKERKRKIEIEQALC